MRENEAFDRMLTRGERRLLARLDSPIRIQEFVDALVYTDEVTYRCPLHVLRDRIAHCYDGAVFAAAALRRLGDPPLILNLFPEPGEDDDHVLALYRRHGAWGVVAKSNCVALRFREPIFSSLRELVMSYFPLYFNTAGHKTLRSYTRPLRLEAFDRYHWMSRDDALDRIADRLDAMGRIPLLTPAMIADLSPVDERTYRAGLLGANPAGLFRPAGLTLSKVRSRLAP